MEHTCTLRIQPGELGRRLRYEGRRWVCVELAETDANGVPAVVLTFGRTPAVRHKSGRKGLTDRPEAV